MLSSNGWGGRSTHPLLPGLPGASARTKTVHRTTQMVTLLLPCLHPPPPPPTAALPSPPPPPPMQHPEGPEQRHEEKPNPPMNTHHLEDVEIQMKMHIQCKLNLIGVRTQARRILSSHASEPHVHHNCFACKWRRLSAKCVSEQARALTEFLSTKTVYFLIPAHRTRAAGHTIVYCQKTKSTLV